MSTFTFCTQNGISVTMTNSPRPEPEPNRKSTATNDHKKAQITIWDLEISSCCLKFVFPSTVIDLQ